MLAAEWWFWALTGFAAVAIFVTEPGWRRAAVRLRAWALRRRLLAPDPATSIDPAPAGPWSEPWLASAAIGLWVCASPWIWGYDDVDGAITVDVVTGATIAVVSLVAIVFPAVAALNALAGLWLVTAPWVAGFGTHDGPVGLSDVIAGLAAGALALRSMTTAERRVQAARPGPVGRIQRRR